MDQYRYSIFQGKSINCWKRSALQKAKVDTAITTFNAPVNLTEGYQEVEYPVRKAFLDSLAAVSYPEDEKFNELYAGFENPRVDFSTFQATPHKLSTYLQVKLNASTAQQLECLLITCGRSVLWLNGTLLTDFSPYTRNHGSETKVSLPLEAGTNELVLYMDDLAERDVNFFVELKILSDCSIEAEIDLPYEAAVFETGIAVLKGLYFDKDYYGKGEIALYSDREDAEMLLLTYDSVTFSEEGSGNLTDFKRQNRCLTLTEGKFSLGDVSEITTSGLTHVYIGYPLPDETYLFKKLVFTVYNEEKLDHSLGADLSQRKQRALELFAALDLDDMNSALAAIALEGELSERSWQKLQPAFQMITDRGDCTDFMFAPLLSFLIQNKDQVPNRYAEKIRELALAFRYWIDEPGNDVMWYFSENHSLLFHACQYFSGHLYDGEIFITSGRTGAEQYLIGKKRLEEWFDQFESYGFSEWNSTTYLPIDLIGFFSLYNAAPDEDIRKRAAKALDFTFKIIAVNHHGGTLSSTFGRTYEHDLKAMRLGEISNLLAIAWDAGHFNYALRASTLFCLSDYLPPDEYLTYLHLDQDEYLTANYLQGINKVETYLYKCRDYSIAGGLRYHCFQKGHQQHLMNISLGDDGTQLWLNNPGEYMHSGENRPSYWAGNGCLPCVSQYKNTMAVKYQLARSYVPFVHLYLPFWCLDEIVTTDDHWLFIRKGAAFSAFRFEEGYQVVITGDTRNREVIANGSDQQILVKCGNTSEFGNFGGFMKALLRSSVTENCFEDPQWGVLEWEKIRYDADYRVAPVVHKKEGTDHD